jgi:beta-alanine degradation protein BauB
MLMASISLDTAFQSTPTISEYLMKKTAFVILLTIAALGVGQAVLAQTPLAVRSVSVPVTELKFYEFMGMPVAKAYGDPAKGAHSNYIKLPGGTVSPVHTHTHDYYGVVIAGVVANEQNPAGPDHPLAPGSYWYQKGGEPHVTKCISPTECLFFVTSSGSFDIHVVP